MTRKKVTIKFMSNFSERKNCFKKRKKGFMKKLSELSILCDVDVCAIIYSPDENQLEVWPSPVGTTIVLSRFMSLSEMDQTRKMSSQESFTRERIEKLKDQLRRLQKENKRKEVENFMYQCMAGMKKVEEFDMHDVDVMNSIIEKTSSDINSRMEALQIAEPIVPPPSTMVAAPSTGGDFSEFPGDELGWMDGPIPSPYFWCSINDKASTSGAAFGNDNNY